MNMKKILFIVFILLISGCTKKEVVYKVDFDFSKVKFDQIRSISYFGKHIGPRSILYFYTDNLKRSLDLISKNKSSLIKLVLDIGAFGDISRDVISNYFSKSDLLAILLYKENRKVKGNTIMYKATIIPFENSDKIALGKYMVKEDRMYPVNFNTEELNTIKETRIVKSGEIISNCAIYKINSNIGEIAFRLSDSEWKIVGRKEKNISGYNFDVYLVKASEKVYDKYEYYVVNGLDYLYKKARHPKGYYEHITEAREIFIPELGFYWNSKLPGKYYVNYKEVNAKRVVR